MQVIAAPYYRVSRADKQRGISIDIQRDMCEAYAQRLGWRLTAAYVDDSKSAYSENVAKRPAFQQLLADAEQQRFTAVLIYKFDRFSRKMLLALQTIARFQKLGIQVISATEPFDYNTSAGRMAARNMMNMAEMYSDLLSDRMKDVRRWEAQQGRHVGPVPVGYMRVEGKLLPTPAGEAIRAGFRLYCTGDYGSHRITDAMNATGHTMPDGSPFKVTAVEEILRCPVYAGYVTCGDEIFAGQHEPLIDQATWERAQEVAKRRAKRRPTTQSVRPPLLAGIAVCAGCGAPMWHKGGLQYAVYQCSAHLTRGHGRSVDVVCDGTKSNAAIVEHITLAWLAGIALTPGLLDEARRLMEQRASPVALPVASVDATLRKLKQAFLNEQITAADYEAQRTALLDRAQAPTTATPQRADPEALLAVLRDLPTLLKEAPPVERRGVVLELVSEVWLRRRRVVALRPTRLAQSLFVAAQGRSDLNDIARWWAGWGSNPRPSA